MRRFVPPVPRQWQLVLCLALAFACVSSLSAQQYQKPIVDPNVNMVRGITFPEGDPYLQRQNEPSIAVSTRNPCHLVAGANDYRAVDIPFDNTELPGGAAAPSNVTLAGDAWLGLFKSVDCGQKWSSTLLPGYPQDNSGLAQELKGYEAGADPTVRAGTNGLFYYSGMVFNRGAQGESKIFVARLIDNNNKERGDPIQFIDVATIDTGTKGQFLDKPWMAVDVPRLSFGPNSQLANGNGPTCNINGQILPAGNVYMVWARFTGDSTDHSKLMFAKSTDCGRTWKTRPISTKQSISQGGNIAIAPHDGTIYLTWREFISPDKPVQIWSAVSSDGGESFTNPKSVAPNPPLFDQLKSTTTFRSNALPAIVADHQDRVYVAWSQRGFGRSYVDGELTPNSDARIVMSVSTDRGRNWSDAFPIDPSTSRGHQVMPSLTFAAGKIQAIYYDAREDASGVFRDFIDDRDIAAGALRHTIDVRGVQAAPADVPVFAATGAASLELSRYRQWNVALPDGTRQSTEVGSNPPNLAMYSAGTMPFMGDYVDVSGLPSFPIQTANGQVWQPNIGPANWGLGGTPLPSISTSAFPTLPIFHAAWTDNRDVRYVGSQCAIPPDPSATGERNANIYTARLTPGLFVGSPGNTKPLGFRTNPATGIPTDQLIQRGFVVFAQNTTDVQKNYQFTIVNQPPGGKASFRQFDRPVNGTPGAPQTQIRVSIPKGSTSARTVYATSTDPAAQILVNVEELPPPPADTDGNGGITWPPAGWMPLRGSILLNPDRTNPRILDPDLDELDPDVPQIATDEIHDPSMFDAQYFRHTSGVKSRQLDVKNPDPENPDPENPDPENPDPENPDPENPDPENPDPENPDPENPDPENPDPENPDPENPDPENSGVLNTALSDAELQNSTVTDINWRVHNNGNTTSAYRFRPSIARHANGQQYQLIVTRRYMTLTIDPITCKPVYKSQNQVIVSLENFRPRMPDPENPDPENPDPENPDPENPDPENPDPENPDPENPDPENANFFLAPDETATVTLRVFTPETEVPPSSTEKIVAAKTEAQAANTGETQPASAVTGPDLTLSEPEPTYTPASVRPGQIATVTWTLTNRGTGPAYSATGTIKNKVYFSTDASLSDDDTQIAATLEVPATLISPLPHCEDEGDPALCRRVFNTPVTMPAAPGTYYVIIVTDTSGEVFEADELNNLVVVPIAVDAYQLFFVQQPSATTQDFSISPAVAVGIAHPDGGAVDLDDVPAVTLAIQNNPAGGTLSGVTVQPNAGGVAIFPDLRIDRAAAGYTLAATAPVSTGAVSAAFTIHPDAPPTAGNDSYTTGEDQPLNAAAPGVLTNDADPATNGVPPPGYGLRSTVVQGPTHGTLTLQADGSFAYTPGAGYSGADTFTYHAADGRAGNNTLATVNISVTSINDAPSFSAGPNQTVAEDSGAQMVPNWATNISAGLNEGSQTVTFLVDNTDNSLFSVQPAISPAGTLTYTPAPNANGIATVTVRLRDNGGLGNGGNDTSAPVNFTISVNAVADAPVGVADSYTTTEDTPLGVDAGGGNGLLANDTDGDPGTFLVVEYLSTTSNGTLAQHGNGSFSYTPNPNFFGTDSFTYRPVDNQNNTGNTVTVTIVVAPRNDVPSFTRGADQTAPAGDFQQIVPGWATAISAGPANESSQLIDFIVSNSNPGLFNVQPVVSPEGTLSFTPKQNQAGVVTVTVRAHDNGGTANGGVDTSAPQTFTITITSTIQTYIVTNTNDSGNGSLRAAILNANANASTDVIQFDIGGSGVRTINLLSPLPAIVFPVRINATTQPGFLGTPIVELNGASAGAGVNGLTIQSSGVVVRGFVINRFSQNGIAINAANAVVTGNYIGTNAAGTAALPNGQDGIGVSGAPNQIGGTAAGDRNVISGNARHGIRINTQANGNVVRGNYIGTNAAGTGALGNAQAGVWIEQSGTTFLGGDAAGDGNVISGNNNHGVMLYTCTFATPCPGHTVAGNRIGTNAAGTSALANRYNGIQVFSSANNTIRGNTISGNGHSAEPLFGDGIAIQSPTLADDPLSESRFGNTVVVGNRIGTDATGAAAIGNARMGVLLTGPTRSRIGGPNASDRNVISGNAGIGVFIGYATSPNNIVQGNYVGTNAAGSQALGNQAGGIFIGNGSTFNLIAGNVVSGNAGAGIFAGDGQNDNNTIQGNTVGQDPSGTVGIPNSGAGIGIAGSNNLISFNRVAQNAGVGIVVNSGSGNRISQNQVFDNQVLGIDLMPVGVTANDASDGDAGANGLQNFPVLTLAFSNNGIASVMGTLNSTPNAAFTLEFFSNTAADPSGNGEGRLFAGSLEVNTDATGHAAFNTSLAGVNPGVFLTATAIGAAGSTSEFSAARLVDANTPPTTANDAASTSEDTSVSVPVLANDADLNGDALTIVNLTAAGNGTASAQADGTVTYVPAPNFFGSDSFTYQVSDGRGGVSPAATVLVTITAVNDAPSFTAGPNQTVDMNAGLQTVANWATNISAGPANEAGQSVQFVVTNDNGALFAVAPAISPAGTLTYQPAPGVAGAAVVSAYLSDSGGLPGVDVSTAVTFTITVTATGAANFIVTNTNDAGNGSLRAAMDNANGTASFDTITFAIPGPGPHVIQPLSPLPIITRHVAIDASSQPGFDGHPVVELDGTNSVPIGFETPTDVSGVTIRGLAITRFQNAGIYMLQHENQGGNVLDQNFIGTDREYVSGKGNGTGIVLRTDNSTVTNNVIGGNSGPGLRLENDADNVQINGNRIGVAPDGSLALPNAVGIRMFGSLTNNLISSNVISGNTGFGIDIQDSGPDVTNTRIRSNVIGLNVDGETPVPNAAGGISLQNANGTTVGGVDFRNVISGNGGPGVRLTGSPAIVPLVQGNYIGTNVAGTAARPNTIGVEVLGNSHAQIGGAAVGLGNVISGNSDSGIRVSGPGAPLTAATIIQGNLIGLDAAGANAMGNGLAGIVTSEAAIDVGGTSPGARNVISAHAHGIIFSNSGSTYNSFIRGNYIGTDITGTVARGNSTGVLVGSAPGTRIGGDVAGAGNLIAGNAVGVSLAAISHAVINVNGVLYNSLVQGNAFGLSAGGAPLPNGYGIALGNSDNLVGGSTAAQANVIANSTNAGVYVAPNMVRNRIVRNSIHGSGGLGIDLANDGVTANDAGDSDLGANTLQNFPVLTAIISDGDGTAVSGTLNSTPNTTFTLEFFTNPATSASGHGEGRTYLGSLSVATDESGNATFGTTFAPVAQGLVVAATATDPAGNTSEFSLARVVTTGNPPTTTNDTLTAYTGDEAVLYAAANDTDPDVSAPELLATVRSQSLGAPQLVSLSDLGVVNATGLAYFTGGVGTSVFLPRLGILNTNTGTVTATSIAVPAAATLVKVNQATQLVYMRAGNNLLGIDGRIGSPTFNQVILSLATGAIQSMAIDETRGRLYLTTTTSTGTAVFQGRLTALDVDPASATFHQVVNELVVPGSSTVFSVVVNPATNRLFVAFGGGSAPGVNVVDGATFVATPIASTNTTSTLVLNAANNMVYAAQGSNLLAIDGNTNTVVATITLPASATIGAIDTRLAVHQGTGKVFVRLSEFPLGSRLAVIDGDRTSPTFNTIQALLPLGRDLGQSMVAVDETANRVITTSRTDLETTIIDAVSNSVIGSVTSTQPKIRLSIDTVHHRAYLHEGAGHIQAVDLVSGTQHSVIQTGLEAVTATVNLASHSTYVAENGPTTGFARVDHTGRLGSVPTPHGDGRVFAMVRNTVTNRHYAINNTADADGGDDALPGFVSVIDGATNAVIANVPVGPGPFQAIAINEVSNRIYVGASSPGFGIPGGITIIDGVSHATVQADLSQLPQSNPTPGLVSFVREFAVNPATNRVYVRIDGGSPATAGVLDGFTNVVTPLPNFGPIRAIRVNPVLNRVYVFGTVLENGFAGEDQVYVLDGSTHEILATIEAGSPSPLSSIQHSMSVNRVTGRVYLADFQDDMLVVIDGATNAPIAGIVVGDGPTSVAVNETLNRIYVANFYDRTLMIVDGATNRVVRSIALPLQPYKLDVDEAVGQVFVLASNNEPGVMVVSDPGTNAPTVTSVTQGAHGAVTLNADGSITYQAAAGYTGVDSYTYTVTDSDGGTATATVNVNVVAGLDITTMALPPATVSSVYNQTIGTAGGTGPRILSVTAGVLPGGLMLDASTGLLTGTVRQNGTFNFTVTARDSGEPQQVASRDFSIVVGPPVITSLSVASAFVGTPYSQTLSVGGATGAVTWTINKFNNPLLEWLSLSPNGVLSGTPPQSGVNFTFNVTATDSLTQSATRTLFLFVNGPLDLGPMREGIVLETQPLSLIGGNGTRSVTLTSGTLPPGLTLVSTGSFTGTPTRHGTYNFTLQLRDCELNPNGTPSCGNQVAQQTVSRNVTLRVSAKDQQGSSQAQNAILFAGPTGPRLAQVVTVGAQGTLTGVGLQNLSCPNVAPVTVDIQRLTLAGVPDGNTIATGTAFTNYNAITIAPEVPVAIGERFAFVISSPVGCSYNNAAVIDQYQGGDAYASFGGGPWQTLFSTYGRYDLPSFRTLIQPARDVIYMQRGRGGHTTTLLSDGRVLIVGNNATAEIYDPATNLTTLTGSMVHGSRTNHAATLLADGTVLITGGRIGGVITTTAEIFDPATGVFSAVTSQMSTIREQHRAVRLMDGRVLVMGGRIESVLLFTKTPLVDIYDPATQTFTPTGSMSLGRELFVAELLPSGRVLAAHGYTTGSGSSAETYDPATGLFTPTAGPVVLNSRGQATATRLPDGRLLIVGGDVGGPRVEAEIYDPATNAFTATGSMARPRYVHSAAVLPDGSVLAAGGYDETSSGYIQPLATMDRYLPTSGTFVAAGAMETVRQAFSALTLPDGKVLLSGGFSSSWMTGNTAELYDPTTALSITPTTLADAPLNVAYPEVTFTGAGGSAPYLIALVSGVVPPGMTYTPATRTLSGTPTATGIYALGFRVVDETGNSVVQTLTLRVGAITAISSPYRLADGAVGVPYELQLTANGTPPVAWALAPANANLPPGLTLSSNGVITGTPNTAAYFNFTVNARDNTGQTATKVLSINVRQPMVITTTSLSHVLLFGGGPCFSTSNHNGTRTFSIIAGAAPAGLVLSGSNSCFTGTVRQTGTFSFTVQVTDQSSPPQVATREFTLNSWALDQDNGFSSNQPELTFGGGTGRRLGQLVKTGITGTLRGVRINGLSCPAGTVVTAALQGMSPSGAPDGGTIASSSVIAPDNRIIFGAGELLAAGAEFALLFDADQACSVRPNNFDSYTGTGFVSEAGGNWVTLQAFDGRFDVPFTTLVEPQAGLIAQELSRGNHTQTMLASGLVLLAGGTGNPTAELLNPATNASTAITTPMTTSRTDHAATLLTDGRVLLTGGYNASGVYQSSAEIFDPVSNTFTAVGSMATARASHTATLLGDGRVFVAGGFTGTTNTSSAELFDPGTGTFQPLAPMSFVRNEHTATLLWDGRVLLAGGYGAGSNAELFDPASQSYVVTDQPMTSQRGRHTATLLSNGTVLITGGTGHVGSVLSSAEIFNPGTGANLNGTFTFTPSGMQLPRYDHTATLLSDGTVLISGGLTDGNCCYPKPPTAAMELYDPQTGTFDGAGSSLVSRYEHAATLLGSNRVLLSGTWGWSSAAGRTAEVIDVSARPRFSGTNTGRGQSGEAYSFTLFPTGGAGGPYTVSIESGRLPLGITYDAATRTFSGTPTESGTFSITVSLTDNANTVVHQTLTFRIDTLLITTVQDLNTAFLGVPYVGVGLSAQGIGAVTWTIISGGLPPGLSLNPADGGITGTPTVSCCFYQFTVRATDAAGQTASQTFAISVQQALTITSTTLGDGTAGDTYGWCVGTVGGSGNRTYSLSGQVPIGLSILNNGCFDSSYPSRVLRQGGTFTLTVHVSDSSLPIQSDSQTFTIRVHAADQTPPANFVNGPVAIPASRRIAQVYQSSSPFPLSGLQLWGNLTCDPGTQVTAQVWRVTGSPARPLETGALAVGQATADPSGFVGNVITFSPHVAMPQGSLFAVTISSDGACSVQGWSTVDYYKRGAAWVDEGSGWTLARTAIGRENLMFNTLVMPSVDQRFFATWRNGAAVVTLADGRVLVAGPDQTAEIYDPVANTVTLTGSMAAARWQPTATLLSNNTVLIAGGQSVVGNQTVALNTSEIFDPATGTFVAGPTMSAGRFDQVATTLADGRVLITGGRAANGQSLASAVLFEADGSSIVELTMTGTRAHHSATLLPDGRVFILGGWAWDPAPATQAEIFDPGVNTFTPVAGGLPWWPSEHTATLLVTGSNAGNVLIAGGAAFYPQLATPTYFFDAGTAEFTVGPAPLAARIQHAATRLADGRVAFTGGAVDWLNWITVSDAEIYDPVTNQFSLAGNMLTDMASHTAPTTTIAGAEYIVAAGGWGSGALASRSGAVFSAAGASAALRISTASLPDGHVGQNYGLILLQCVNAVGICDYSLAWGSLPPGLFLSINGDIEGVPAASGVYSFVVRVVDSSSNTATRAFTLIIDRLSITSGPTLPGGAAGIPYSHQLTASGGDASLTWTVDWGLPPGLSLSAAGLLSGTVPAAGFWTFGVRVTDTSGQVAIRTLSIQFITGGP